LVAPQVTIALINRARFKFHTSLQQHC